MKKIYLSITFLLFMLYSGCVSSIVDDPAIIINYTVLEKSSVKLTIENSYNTLIKTLVDNEQNAGGYTATIDVNDLAEGVYYYTLELKGIDSDYYYKETKQLLLVK